MQRVSVVDKPEWSSLDRGFGVPSVGVRRISDRSSWTGVTTSSDLRISISSDIVARDPIALNAANEGRSGGTPALALPEPFRLVDEFHVGFEAGQGTTITATKWCRRR